MVPRWESEVERPWVGMTSESMTDVEQARADLVAARESLQERSDMPRGIRRAVERAQENGVRLPTHPTRLAAAILAAVVAAVCAFVSLRAVASRRRR